MAEDILLKVRLDTSGARRDLQALYGDMARAPRTAVSPTGGGVSGGGRAPAAGGGGGGGMGGMALGGIAASLAAVAGTLQMIAGQRTSYLAGGLKDQAREFALGSQYGSARGQIAAADATAGRLGLAYEYGLISDNQLKQAYEVERDFGTGAQTRGTAKARAALFETVSGDMKKSAEKSLGELETKVGIIVDLLQMGLERGMR